MNTTPPPQNDTTHPTAGILGRFGLATIVGLFLVVPFSLTVLYPPWSKVDCQRRQILYWSEQTEVHSSSFAGFDFLFSTAKWHREQTPPNPSSDTYFKSIEYQIAYPVLLFEWFLLAVGGVVAYWRISRRIFSPLLSTVPVNDKIPTQIPSK